MQYVREMREMKEMRLGGLYPRPLRERVALRRRVRGVKYDHSTVVLKERRIRRELKDL